MAPRSSWHQIKGRWTRTLGEHGLRIRLFQKRKGGTFYRAVWLSDSGTDRKCLHTKDRAEAERLGRALLSARLREDYQAPASRVLTLGVLWHRFRHESQNFLDNTIRSRQDAAVRAATLIAYFGAGCDVRMLSGDEQSAYTVARRAGGIRVSADYVTVPVRLRSAESDLVILHEMLNWAATVRVKGVRLLDGNPLAGIRRLREQNPRRPIASFERYTATRAAMQQLCSKEETDAARTRWARWSSRSFLPKPPVGGSARFAS